MTGDPRPRAQPRRDTEHRLRLGRGDTRDVSMIDGEVEVIEIDALSQERAPAAS